MKRALRAHQVTDWKAYWAGPDQELRDPGAETRVDSGSARVGRAPGGVMLGLAESQRNYASFGATEERFRPYVRSPRPSDTRDPSWRPVAAVDLEGPLRPVDLADDQWRPELLCYWLRHPT